MVSKKILVPVSVFVLFCFSTTCIAGNLPLGMYAVETRIGEPQEKQGEEKITYIQAKTDLKGKRIIHDDTHNMSVLVSTVDQAGASIGTVQFEYINTGRTIICIVRNNPDYLPSFVIEPFPQSSGSVEYRSTTVGSQLRVVGVITTTIIVVITIVLSGYGAYQLIVEDPPYIETIRHDPSWVKKRLCGDVEDIIDFLGIIPFVGFKGKWIKFAVSAAKAISGKVARKGLGAIGIDPYRKYCYTLYESRDDPTSKAPFMSVVEYTNDPPYVPRNRSPDNRAIDQPINIDLSWKGGDPDPGDEVTYDIYFEANDSSPDELVSSHQSRTSYNLRTLSRDTHYYWRIIATDNHGKSTPGPVWDFTTIDIDNPPTVEITNPSYAAVVSRTVTVSANASDDEGIDRVKFYIDDNLAKTDSSSPYSYRWDTTQYSVGSHTIKVICYDTANQTAGDTVSVLVDRLVIPPRTEKTIRPRRDEPSFWGKILILLILYWVGQWLHG